MKKKYTSFEICTMAVSVSCGLVLQYIESQFAVLPIPGGKLGLANIVSMINLSLFGGGCTMLIALCRAFVGALITGGAGAVPYSVSGAAAAVCAMWFCRRHFSPAVSMIGEGVLGAAAHNAAQLLVACAVLNSAYALSYLPSLLVIAVICGSATGYAAKLLCGRIMKIYRRKA